MECEGLRADETLDKVKLVLVSPFNRALMTAKVIFGHRPARVMVHPLLA
jgi:phosphohistidine phosphatase SixA